MLFLTQSTILMNCDDFIQPIVHYFMSYTEVQLMNNISWSKNTKEDVKLRVKNEITNFINNLYRSFIGIDDEFKTEKKFEVNGNNFRIVFHIEDDCFENKFLGITIRGPWELHNDFEFSKSERDIETLVNKYYINAIEKFADYGGYKRILILENDSSYSHNDLMSFLRRIKNS